MLRNIIFGVVGVVLGFVLGFFITNNFSRPSSFVGESTPASGVVGAAAVAPPLDPERAMGNLPPDHPTIGDPTSPNQNIASAAANSTQAQEAMEQADRTPTDFNSQMNAAAIFYQLGDYAKATLYLKRALELKPRDPDALVAMGDTLYDSNNVIQAAEFYERALKERPDDPNVRTDLGNTYFKRTPPDYRRAIEHYKAALALDPRHEKTLQNIALSHLNIGESDEARKHVNQLSQVNPQNAALASLRQNLGG